MNIQAGHSAKELSLYRLYARPSESTTCILYGNEKTCPMCADSFVKQNCIQTALHYISRPPLNRNGSSSLFILGTQRLTLTKNMTHDINKFDGRSDGQEAER
jgi:hypothetical protein